MNWGLGIMVGIFIFLIGMTTVNFLMDDITTARGSSALDCSNTSITDGQKLTCVIVDFTIPYWFIIVLSAVGGLVAARFLK